jgi:hypothetical protein
MISIDKPNPFSLLGLPTNASSNDIVERGQELVELAENEETRLLYRWAMEQLITNTTTRLEYELFEFPATAYDDSEWQRFVRSHTANPVDLAALASATTAPRPEDFNQVLLLRWVADSLMAAPPASLAAVLEGVPFDPGFGSVPLEVSDVIFG